jgi:hypothetical protein
MTSSPSLVLGGYPRALKKEALKKEQRFDTKGRLRIPLVGLLVEAQEGR